MLETVTAPVKDHASSHVNLTWLLAETTAIQALGTSAVLIVPALAPVIAANLGVPSNYAGYQVSVVYAAAMLSSLMGGSFVAAFGPCRTGQIAMALVAAGSLLVGIPTLAGMIFGSLAIGLSYGLINPSASQLLLRHSPPARRNLFFSIKQTGVPIGGMIVGIVGVRLAVSVGWSAVLWMLAATALALMLALQPARRVLDGERTRPESFLRSSIAGFEIIRSNRSLVLFASTSFFFSAIQLCLVAFLVVLLVEDLDVGLVEAGVILAAVQVMGALGRIVWGLVADRIGSGSLVLVLLAALMAAGSAAVALIGSAAPLPIVVAIFMLLGLSAVGWNGVYLSEIAGRSPPNAAGSVTGTAMFITFAGVLFGPTLFSLAHGVLGSYIASYGLLAAFGVAGGALAIAARRASSSR
ncbi:MFS transporter [Jiella endophytica]|uniref:MFS transporter n=1 Tax=Jiella endophytica TaxID=2558362 RepID=A0A4Y8RU39_9HYPH|nr:MFS transporter [Jiella endophytica]TFF27317.1 MFS transporter [Jiella endophytica]